MKVHNVHAWLQVATQNLSHEASSRIFQDIQAHVNDSKLDFIEQGCSLSEAEERAVSSLGNPNEVAKRYERIYFTKDDEQRIADLMQPIWWARISFWLGAIVLVVGVGFAFRQPEMVVGSESLFNINNWVYLLGYCVFLGILFYEKEIKNWVQIKYPKDYFFRIQLVFVILFFPTLLGNLVEIFLTIQSLIRGKFETHLQFSPLTLILVWAWVENQSPLFLKFFRREFL